MSGCARLQVPVDPCALPAALQAGAGSAPSSSCSSTPRCCCRAFCRRVGAYNWGVVVVRGWQAVGKASGLPYALEA